MSDETQIVNAKMAKLSAYHELGQAREARETIMHDIFVLLEDIRTEIHAGIMSHRSSELCSLLAQNKAAKEAVEACESKYEEAGAYYQSLLFTE